MAKANQLPGEQDEQSHQQQSPSQHTGRVDEDMSDQEETDQEEDASDIEERLAASRRRRFLPTDCLFCAIRSSTAEESLQHMFSVHSFYLPDRELLIDLPGLLSYLGEKVVVGNICLFCPGGAKEFGNVEAVRRHMIDKGHCKLAFETDEDRAEVADYYSFEVVDDEDGWEDMDDEGDHSMDERSLTRVSPSAPVVIWSSLWKTGITLSEDGLSLVLPSGRVLGHRALRVYYAQKFRPVSENAASADMSVSKLARVKERLADPSQALITVAGGTGGYGRGLEVMNARNAGEARWANKQAQGFRDQKAREAHKTKMGFKHNNQKRESSLARVSLTTCRLPRSSM